MFRSSIVIISLAGLLGMKAEASAGQAQKTRTPAASVQAPAAAAQKPADVSRAAFTTLSQKAFRDLDGNKDGKVSQQELAQAQQKAEQQRAANLAKRQQDVFIRADADRDGKLSLVEFNKLVAPRPPAMPSAAQIVSTLDRNRDGSVSEQEFLADRNAQFDRLDTDKSGTLTAGEARRPGQSRQP